MTWDDRQENIETCKRIADRLERCCAGDAYKCPSCGNIEYTPEALCCCGDMDDMDEWEQLGVLGNTEVFDIEYRIGLDLQYRSVELMIAGGGPSIYIDTQSHSIELYWGTDHVTYPLSYELCDAIDELFSTAYEGGFSRRF